MKLKRQKQNRRIVRFFKTCYGFHEPFKVLCDGNFIHVTMSSAALEGPQECLARLLGSRPKAMVTPCITKELRRLGPAFAETTRAAHSLPLAKCSHEKPVLASECIRAMVGASNSGHFFVASQDLELRRQLRQVPGVALVFTKKSIPVLEPPSEASEKRASMGERERAGVGAEELKAIEAQERHRRQLEAAMEAAASREGLVLPHIHPLVESKKEAATLGFNAMADGPANIAVEQQVKGILAAVLKKKRPRRPKGPNPLSVKPKKQETSQTPAREASKDKKKRRRVRRSNRKDST